MIGISGTSRNGRLYSYYSCKKAQLRICDKKNVSKDYIEDLVIHECRKILTDENIYLIAKEVSDLCKKESASPYIKQLKSEINQSKAAIEILFKALEKGMEMDLILARLSAKREEKERLEAQLAKEEMSQINLTEPEIRFFLSKLKNGDINDLKYRKALVNIFVNRIYLYDDRLTIIFNTNDKPVTITSTLLTDILGSSGSYTDMIAVPIRTKRQPLNQR